MLHSIPGEAERAIRSSESKTVGERNVDSSLLGSSWRIVAVKLLRSGFQVDCWGHYVLRKG